MTTVALLPVMIVAHDENSNVQQLNKNTFTFIIVFIFKDFTQYPFSRFRNPFSRIPSLGSAACYCKNPTASSISISNAKQK
jgi:hypothetical protein